MQEASFQLGESSFVHRKSGVCLRTRANIEPMHAWFPRARNIRLSLHVSFADDLELTPLAGRDVKTTIAKNLENADLWKQLGYEASLDPSVSHHQRVDFDLCSQRHNGSSALCPNGISPKILRSIHLHLHFAGPVRSAEELEKTPGVRRDNQELDGTHLGLLAPQKQVEAFLLPALRHTEPKHGRRPPVLTPGSPGCRVEEAYSLVPRLQKPTKTTSLDEVTLMALFDAGFRSSIAPRPTRLAAGVRLSSEQDLLRLCDIAPTSFTPHYTQKFEDQAKFTSGISRFLTAFLAASRSRTPDGHVGQKGACSQEKEECGGFKSTTELQKDLWETIASGVQNHELARRLRPLWSSMTGHPSGRLTKPPDHTDHGAPLQDENPFCEISNLSLHQHSSYPSTDEEDLFDCTAKFDRQANRFPGCMPIATYQDNDGRHNAVAMDICDAEMGDPRSNRYCEADSLVDSHDRNRGRTGSMSQTSDVSTFMTLEQPIEEAPIIGQPGVIGGPRWLAQHIIRTHPLRQHESEVSLAEQCDLNGKGHSLCERAGWRWSEESLSSEGLLESQVLGPQYTTPQGTGICSSLVDLHKQQLTPELRDAAYGSIEHSKCDSTPILMSAQQGASSSNAPLADVLGDDHLLWYMWKRRASVALRGEEEVHEMRNMYEMDPDMKVFGAGWGIDLSDIGPESNEDPMLQDNMENPSPMGDDTQPPTPTSERRSFFSPIRSASSSSAVGSRNSSSKLHSRGNILKRFSWGVRRHAVEVTEFDAANPGGRTIEVKRRKTLDDYEMMDMEASNDDSNEMLF